jgi:hypothetical protein
VELGWRESQQDKKGGSIETAKRYTSGNRRGGQRIRRRGTRGGNKESKRTSNDSKSCVEQDGSRRGKERKHAG